MKPRNHSVTITLGPGQHLRGQVVYLQPKAERWRQQSAEVHIVTMDWLEPYGYSARYETGTRSFAGRYVVVGYERADGGKWLFKGTFDVEE